MTTQTTPTTATPTSTPANGATSATLPTTLATDLAAHERFAAMYAAHSANVYRLGRSIYGLSHEEAEDVAQDTWRRIWAADVMKVEPEREHMWVFSIANNVARDLLRYKRPRASNVSLSTWGNVEDGDQNEQSPADSYLTDERQDVERIIEARTTLVDVVGACRTPRQRAIALLTMQGYTMQETAELLSTTTGTVKAELGRLRHNQLGLPRRGLQRRPKVTDL